MTGRAKEEPEDREMIVGVPTKPGRGRGMPDEGKEGRDERREDPGGDKDMAGAEEMPEEEGKREEAEEEETDRRAEETPERKPRDPRPLPGRKPTGSTEGLETPMNCRKVQSNDDTTSPRPRGTGTHISVMYHRFPTLRPPARNPSARCTITLSPHPTIFLISHF